jgi:SAM-dependent methyltransferase/uncharacterized protein YbaR (Trm112 family)
MLDAWYLENLVCPVDGSALRLSGSFLVSEAGRRYPIVEGMPVMLRHDLKQTMGPARKSLDLGTAIANGLTRGDPPLYADTLGISDEQRALAWRLQASEADYDAVVAFIIGATSGTAYKHLIGESNPYPIPAFRFQTAKPGRLLDVGCNWGRWTISAARQGHHAVGIDPQLGAVIAARRVASQLGVEAWFVVGDARCLPFRRGSFDYVWSYSVLQHFSREDAKSSLHEIRRILRSEGIARIQMANALGLRSFYQIARRAFRTPQGFEVRYWSPAELRSTFIKILGHTMLTADCYFGLGLQWSDFRRMTLLGRSALIASEVLRRVSNFIPPLCWFADSLFCTSHTPD